MNNTITPSSNRGFLMASYTTIGLLGVLGNSLVLFVFRKSRNLRKYNSSLFIINQSLLDLVSAVVLIVAKWVEEEVDESRALKNDVAKWLFCHLWFGEIALWGLMTSSTYNLVVLSLERYASVRHPITHKRYVGKRVILTAAITVWILGWGYETIYHGAVNKVFPSGHCGSFANWPNDQVRQAIGIFTLVLQFFFPLIVLSFSYISIWNIFRTKVSANGNRNGTTIQTKAEKNERVRKNTIKTFMIVAVAFVLCWSWNEVYFFIFNLGYPLSLDSSFYHFTVLMVFLNCCINPVVYMVRYEEFKLSLKRLFKSRIAPVITEETSCAD
ncbi:unnamed protein product [Dimorphilus gyrociliatus]|uniref:G-protein coupled receptors family 1 profile domain-containing protein n=1 Tax=Dimorphilus gyrociliatus TaxID=2664684 RepID=A0A7I8V4J6_9ANNE|nr:unnamed protein product [Dimorphilus gyrociliatus]